MSIVRNRKDRLSADKWDAAQVSIVGHPVARFELHGLMSVNRFDNLHPMAKAATRRKWRELGLEMGISAIWDRGTNACIQHRALVLAKVWTPHEGIMDIHNLYLKPFYDGLSDAGLWKDDEWATVPLTISLWAGSGTELSAPRKKRGKRRVRLSKTILEIYELEFVSLSGERQRLPKGRRRL